MQIGGLYIEIVDEMIRQKSVEISMVVESWELLQRFVVVLLVQIVVVFEIGCDIVLIGVVKGVDSRYGLSRGRVFRCVVG